MEDKEEMITHAIASGLSHAHLPMCLLLACLRPWVIPSLYRPVSSLQRQSLVSTLFLWLTEPRVLCKHSKHTATELQLQPFDFLSV